MEFFSTKVRTPLIFGINFWEKQIQTMGFSMRLQLFAIWVPRCAKMWPRCAKREPRWAKRGGSWAKIGSKMGQDRLKMAPSCRQDDPRLHRDGWFLRLLVLKAMQQSIKAVRFSGFLHFFPISAPRCAKMRQRCAKRGIRWAKRGTSWAKIVS